jgi:hypothetical protein
VRRGGVQPPLQDVAVDHHRARQLAVADPLLDRTRVDHERAGRLLAWQVLGVHPVEAGTSAGEECVDLRLFRHDAPPQVPVWNYPVAPD